MKEYNCNVRIHSRHHLELKSEYPLQTDTKMADYEMNFYLFFPNQLNITEKRIGVDKFINNIRVYTRFSTPGLPLKLIFDKECDLSPLTRIRKYLEMAEIEQPHQKDTLLYELQVLANIYRSEIDNTVQLLGEEVKKQNRDSMCSKKIKHFMEEIQTFLKEFRKLYALFINPRVNTVHREALAWADEAVSIITERGLNRLFSYTTEIESSENLLKAIEKITKSENQYRQDMDYQYLYIEDDSRSGERLAYRESMLKKWSQSAMYMTNEDSRTPHRIGHFLAGIAAAVAMIFAVLVTIFAGRVFIPNSTPWVLLIVLSYVFKDRIKEVLREIFKNLLPRITSDQLNILFDPSLKKRVGISRGFASFGTASGVPDDIFKTRYHKPNPFRSILPEENVIFYQRAIRLNPKKLTDQHSRLSSVTEIIRINIEDWLKEMDDPKDIFYRLDDMKKLKIKGNRVYRIHLVMNLRNLKSLGNQEIHHYCVVINKIGIVRIEDLDIT